MKKGEASTKPKRRKLKSSTEPGKTSKPVKSAAKSKVEAQKAAKRPVEKKVKTPKPSEIKETKPEKKVKKKVKVATPVGAGIKELLKLREEVRKNRAKFLRQESWRYVRVGDAWRKPKGTDSKMRLRKKGWPGLVKISYGGPTKARGLHPSGFRDILVNTPDDLERLNPETDAVRFAAGLGGRKRGEMLRRAEELGLKVLNPRGIRVIRAKE